MLGTSRTVKCQLQGKAARTVGPRLAARSAHKVSRSFTDRRRALVTVAAAESDAAPQQKAARAPARSLSSISPGEIVEGRVASIQSFGAFVDIGAEASGLVHVSQLADGFVKNVADVVKVGDIVKVKVLSVDVEGKRLALSRKGLSPRPAAAAAAGPAEDVEDALLAEDAEASDPNSAEVDGLAFFVEDAEDEGADDSELDPAEVEFVEDIPAEVAREIAIACEDLVNGTVTAVSEAGVTVSYTLSDGTPVEGVIAVDELLAPAYMVADGDDAPEEAEEYVEVENINPAQYYKVGDSISCAVFDVLEGGKPVLTQRLPEEADDELAELAEELDQFENVDEMSDALLIEGLWAAEEAVDEDEDGPAENADVMLEQVAPLQEVAVEEEEGEVVMVSTAPEELRMQVLTQRSAAAPSRNSSLLATAGLNLPSRALTTSPSDEVTGALFEEYGNNQVDFDDVDEDELIGVSVSGASSGSYIPRRMLKKIGYKIVKDEESGEWQAVEREGADQIEISDSLAAELEALAAGTAPDVREINAIVRDLMTDDDDLEEAELPLFARRNPVVAAAAVSAGISASDVKALRQKTGAGMMDCKKALAENGGDSDKAVEWLRQKGLSGADKKAGRVAAEGAIVRYIHPGSRLGVLLEVNCETDFVAAGEAFTRLAGELAMVVASSDVVCVSVEDMPADVLAKEREVEMGKEDLKSKPEAVRAKIVEGRLDKIKKNYALLEQPALRDNNKTVGEIIKETIAATGENIQVRRFVKFNLGEGLEKRSNDFAAEVAQQTQKKDAAPAAAPAAKEQPKQQEPAAAAKPAVQVSAAQVKQLRDKSGAGMMDCKKALAECNGDVEVASEWLRKKGLASADKKAGRLAAEGGVLAYIHPGSRLGVLLEVNCETDFVAAGEVFNQLANALAMQIAASTVEYVAADEIPADVFEKEKEIEMGREDLQSKPEAIRAKIAEGRVKKLVQERVLLEQPYLLDQNKTVAEAVKEAIASCGENIQVRRFVRFTLGEGIEKKESNLAAEVAAATGKA